MASKGEKEVVKRAKESVVGSSNANASSASSSGKEAAVEKNKGNKGKGLEYLFVLLVILAIIIIAYLAFSNFLLTPFSTFASNFHAAPRVALVVFFSNESEYVSEYTCFTRMIESIAYTRNATTIDFFIINGTTCTYPSTGLGKPIQIATTNASKCLSVAKAEPSIFMNYSITNRTIITPYHLYIYGNNAYMSACPIASDLI